MSVYARIISRYLIGGVILGWLAARGYIPQDVVDTIKNDPEFTAAVAGVLAVIVEFVTVMARRLGWKT